MYALVCAVGVLLSALALAGCSGAHGDGFAENQFLNFKATAYNGKYEYIHVGSREGGVPLPAMTIRDPDGRTFVISECTPGMFSREKFYHAVKTGDNEVFTQGNSSIEFQSGRLIRATLSAVEGFGYGTSERGPFVELPCTMAEFHKVFGQPNERHPFPVTAP